MFSKKDILVLPLVLLLSCVVAAEKPNQVNLINKLKLDKKDGKANDIKALQAEMLVLKSEENAISQLKALIVKHKKSPIAADLNFRLAELYMRRSKTERFLELQKDSEIVSIAPALVSNASTKTVLKNAINIYDNIIRNYKSYSKMDLVLYNNAYARQQIGDDTYARKLYATLIKRYKTSHLLPDSHLAIGQMSFKEKKFKKALAHFKQVIKHPKSKVYPFGMYMGSWAYYNLGSFNPGLKMLEQVVAFGKIVESKKLDARLDLRNEAIADMPIFYSEVLSADGAHSYFAKQGGKEAVPQNLVRLAKIYQRHSKHEDEITVLNDVLTEMPKTDLAPEVYDMLIANYDSNKEITKAVTHLESLSVVCKANSKWLKAQSDVAVANENCEEYLWPTSIRLAQKYLKYWRHDNKLVNYGDASEKSFKVYLEGNTDIENTTTARYNYAELLFQREKFRESSAQYTLVGSATKDKKVAHDSMYAAIVGLEKAVGDNWVSKDEEQFLKLAGTYVTANPKGQYVLDINFKRGLIAYEKKRYAEAGPVFLSVGKQFPDTDKGQKAQDLYLDILNIDKKFTEIKNYSKSLIDTKKLKDERVVKLTKIYEQAYFLEIQKIEESGNNALALSEYKKFSNENSKSPLAEKAYLNAININRKMNDLLSASKSAEEFANLFPKSKERISVLVKAAGDYENMAQLESAARVLERLGSERVKDQQSAKYFFLSAEFNFVMGNFEKARTMFHDLSSLDNPELKSQSLSKLKEINDKQNYGHSEGLIKKLAQSGNRADIGEARIKKVEQDLNLGNNPVAFKAAKSIISGSYSSAVKSRARLVQAKILEAEYKNQSMQASLKRFATVLSLKTSKLEKAQSAYESTIKYKDADTTIESLVRLAELYDDFAFSLKNIPMPTGLPVDDFEAFQVELEDLSLPMEDKAVETMSAALEQAKKLNIKDGRIAKINAKLNKLNLDDKRIEISGDIKPEAVIPRYISNKKCKGNACITSYSLSEIKTSRNKCTAMPVAALSALETPKILAHTSYCIKENNWKQVAVNAERLAQHHPDKPWGAYYLSMIADKDGKKEKAAWLSDLALKKSNKIGALHYQKAKLLWDLEKFDAAWAIIDTLSQFKDKIPSLYSFKGKTFLRDYQVKKAEKALLKHLSFGKNLETTNMLVQLYNYIGKHEKTLEYIAKSLKIQSSLEKRLLAAEIYENRLNNKKEAFKQYSLAKKMSIKSSEKSEFDIDKKILTLRTALEAAKAPKKVIAKETKAVEAVNKQNREPASEGAE